MFPKYLFRTRLGRWWHCLLRRHRPYDLKMADGSLYICCADCAAEMDRIALKLKLKGRDED